MDFQFFFDTLNANKSNMTIQYICHYTDYLITIGIDR